MIWTNYKTASSGQRHSTVFIADLYRKLQNIDTYWFLSEFRIEKVIQKLLAVAQKSSLDEKPFLAEEHSTL